MQSVVKKYRYSLDGSNRLVLKKGRKKILADGRFSIDNNNRLIYWLNEPNHWRRYYHLPGKISFRGNWKLNHNYDLEMNLDETKNQHKDRRLGIRGEIISVDKDTLVFEMKSYDSQGNVHLQILKLSGTWRADDNNRLCFTVKKRGSPDVLTLEGNWQVNQNQQIAYSYEKTGLKTKDKTTHTLTFRGFWQINGANRLTYILEDSLKSRFNFRVQIETPNLYPQEGVIKYRLGIGVRTKGQSHIKVLCLYGTWKFNKKYGLVFQMDYGQGEVQSIDFGGNIYLTRKDKIIVSLVNKRKEPLGISVILSHKLLKTFDAESFLKFKKLQKQEGIEAGLRIPF